MADLQQIAESFRAALLARDRAAAARMVAAYGLAWQRLQTQLKSVTDDIEAARARGEVPEKSWFIRRERFAVLLREVERELRTLAGFSTGLITAAQRQEYARGAADALAILEAGAAQAGQGGPAGGTPAPGTAVAAAFNRLPTGAAEQLVGTLADGSPLSALLRKLPGEGKAAVAQALIEGVTLGENPRKVANRMRAAFGGNLTRALRVARTEQIRAYRESTQATYRANSDRVAGWQWLSARSARTCAACWSMDGQIFPLDVPFSSHVQCRCSHVPILKSAPPFLDKTGEEAFAALPEAKQREILGPAKFAAYQAGEITLRDLVAYHRDPKWGASRTERGLKDALRGEDPAAVWGKTPGEFLAERAPAAQEPIAPAAPAGKPARTAAEARAEITRLSDEGEGPAIFAEIAYRQAVQAEVAAANAPDRTAQGQSYAEWFKRRRELQEVARAKREAFNERVREVLYQDVPAAFKIKNRKLEPAWAKGVEAFRRFVGPGLLDEQTVNFKKIRGRANYGLNDEVRVKGTDDASVIVHELGHWLEDKNAEIFAAVTAFLDRRTKGESAVPLRKFRRGYGAGEIAKPDKFMDPYIGKVYNSRRDGKRFASEVVSMGLQYFYEKPVEFAKQDPDFFDFIYDLVRKPRG